LIEKWGEAKEESLVQHLCPLGDALRCLIIAELYVSAWLRFADKTEYFESISSSSSSPPPSVSPRTDVNNAVCIVAMVKRRDSPEAR
jgi:hypothetical protein